MLLFQTDNATAGTTCAHINRSDRKFRPPADFPAFVRTLSAEDFRRSASLFHDRLGGFVRHKCCRSGRQHVF